ncbi:MAG: asparagine synthase (glutamine-hydrolyzing) [Bacteroidetes bacterium]|nr:asparagine synthase (glutamine-hydrolyzing) [Bacteroidota bacterium]
MCGIAGIIQPEKGIFSRSHIKNMTDSLSHRGPDGEGYWQNEEETVLLGHRRLSIIDLSKAGSQPLHYLGRYTIVHNGEIYNYIEIKEDLKKKGYYFHSESDTEVIAAAYDCYKRECVDEFDGMFAFAIWDEKEKEFFAARDRFGEKPFFYSFTNKQLVFASEMKAIWATGIERKPNFKMLFNFITIGYTGNPASLQETFFENMYKLPAASCIYFKPGNSELLLEKYWDLNTDEGNINIAVTEAIEKFRYLFSQSIKRRFRSDVPVGTSLSGGLDSSSIIAFSHDSNELSDSHKCFTAIFPGYENDEEIYASEVARHCNMWHYTVSMSAAELANDIEKLVYHQEEPFGSASVYAQYKVYELAARNGIKSMLDGQGADEILAGYYKYYKWYWQELFMKRRLLRSRELKFARENGVKERFGFNNIIAAFFPDMASVFLERQYLLNALQHDDLTKEFVHHQSKEAYYTAPPVTGLNDALYFTTCINGLEELLRYADRNSMAHGCEVRLPFLDHHLVEFIFSLPAGFKIREGWTKWILRKTVCDKLPAEIVWRKNKIGFEPPQQQWMEDKSMQELVIDSRKKLIEEKILKPVVAGKKISSTSSYAADNYDWRYLMAGLFLK